MLTIENWGERLLLLFFFIQRHLRGIKEIPQTKEKHVILQINWTHRLTTEFKKRSTCLRGVSLKGEYMWIKMMWAQQIKERFCRVWSALTLWGGGCSLRIVSLDGNNEPVWQCWVEGKGLSFNLVVMLSEGVTTSLPKKASQVSLHWLYLHYIQS